MTDVEGDAREVVSSRPARDGGHRLRLEPLERDGDWNEVLRNAPGATGFHGLGWLRAIAPELGLRFVPLVVRDEGGVCGIAPLLLTTGAVRTAPNLPFP